MKKSFFLLAIFFFLFQQCNSQPVTPLDEEKPIETGETGEGDQNQIKNVTISYESNYDPLPPTGAKISVWNGRSIAENEDMIFAWLFSCIRC